jgi:hypothetical protein
MIDHCLNLYLLSLSSNKKKKVMYVDFSFTCEVCYRNKIIRARSNNTYRLATIFYKKLYLYIQINVDIKVPAFSCHPLLPTNNH